jgi:ERF superfamily
MSEAEPASLHEALVKFQADAPRITKDAKAKVGAYEYEYVKLSTLSEEVLPRLAALGLTWVTKPMIHEPSGQPALGYALSFGDEAIEGVAPLMMKGGGPQDLGGAITYMRRYVLCAVLGLAPDTDDDAAQAQQASKPPKQATKKQAEALVKRARDVGVLDKLQLAASHVVGDDVGPCESEDEALAMVQKLTQPQAEKLDLWISRKEAE